MKKVLVSAAMMALLAVPAGLFAQKEKSKDKIKDKDKHTEEIVIRNKGGNDLKLKVEINGEDVTVNGKPLSEFIDNNVSVSKRKMTIRDGNGGASIFSFDNDGFGQAFGENWNRNWAQSDNGAFLGVTTDGSDDGAKVTEVVKGSAAEKAGLKEGDLITKIDDDKIDDESTLYDLICCKKPKQEVKVTYKRDGKENTVKAELGQRKGSRSYSYSGPRGKVRSFSFPEVPNAPEWDNGDGPAALAPLENLDISPYMDFAYAFGGRKKIGLKLQDTEDGDGVKVINVEDSSASANAGLKKDDIITEINGKKVENTDDAREELAPDPDKKSYKLKAKRNGKEMEFEVKIPRKLKTADF